MTSTVSKQFEEAFAACKMQSKTSVPVQKFTSESAFSALYESDEEEQEVEVSYTRGPSVAVAQAPQGAWNTKFSIQTAMKPAMKPATKPAMKPARVEVKKCTNLPRKDAIIAELADLNAELQEETQKSSGAWADAGDIDDLETKIADLEEELESLDTIFLC
jgi:hypothetical protein